MRSVHDDKPKEWGKTLEYAVSRLTMAEVFMPYKTTNGKMRMRGCPLIVAFGTKAELFYFIYRSSSDDNNDNGEGRQWQTSPQSLSLPTETFKVSPNHPDSMKRLVQLIPGDEPFDVSNENARAELERWILLFRDGYHQRKEYDPLTKQYLPIIGMGETDAKGNTGEGEEGA